MTYNTLKFGTKASLARVAPFGQVLDSTRPDVLCVQKLQEAEDYASCHLSVTGPHGYTVTPFIDGAESDDDLFYRPNVVAVLDVEEITAAAHLYTFHTLETVDTI